MRRWILFAMVAVLAGCSDRAPEVARDDTSWTLDCGDDVVPAGSAPVPAGFVLVINELQEPEGCGAGFKRHLIYVPEQDVPDPLAGFAAGLRAQGWVMTECVTASEVCLERVGLFIAATTPAALAAEAVGGFPDPAGTGPQVLAVMQLDEGAEPSALGSVEGVRRG